MSRKRMTTLSFNLSALSPFVIFDGDYAVRVRSLEYFYDTWQKCITGQDDVSRTRITTLTFLFLELSLCFFLKLILCPLCTTILFGIF